MCVGQRVRDCSRRTTVHHLEPTVRVRLPLKLTKHTMEQYWRKHVTSLTLNWFLGDLVAGAAATWDSEKPAEGQQNSTDTDQLKVTNTGTGRHLIILHLKKVRSYILKWFISLFDSDKSSLNATHHIEPRIKLQGRVVKYRQLESIVF